jgi:hypothetical protein
MFDLETIIKINNNKPGDIEGGQPQAEPEPDLRAALQWLLDDLTDAGEDKDPETGETFDSVANAREVLRRTKPELCSDKVCPKVAPAEAKRVAMFDVKILEGYIRVIATDRLDASIRARVILTHARCVGLRLGAPLPVDQ